MDKCARVFLLGACVVFFYSLASVMAQDDPFNTTAVLDSSRQEARLLAGTPDKVFHGTISNLDTTLTFDLGELRGGVSYLLEVDLLNAVGVPLTYTDISASCGCLSGLPENVDLKPNAHISFRTRFTPANDGEGFRKLVALVDKRTQSSVMVVFQGTSSNIVAFKDTVFAVKGLGKQTFETEATFPFANEFDPELFVYRVGTGIVSGYRMETRQDGRRVFVIDVVTDQDDDGVQSVLLEVMNRRGLPLGTIPLYFRMAYKPLSRPSLVPLRAKADGTLVGRAIIQLVGLSHSGQKTTRNGILKAVSRSDDERKLDIPIEMMLVGKGDFLTIAEITVRDATELQNLNEWDLSIEFKGTDDSLVVPLEVFK